MTRFLERSNRKLFRAVVGQVDSCPRTVDGLPFRIFADYTSPVYSNFVANNIANGGVDRWVQMPVSVEPKINLCGDGRSTRVLERSMDSPSEFSLSKSRRFIPIVSQIILPTEASVAGCKCPCPMSRKLFCAVAGPFDSFPGGYLVYGLWWLNFSADSCTVDGSEDGCGLVQRRRQSLGASARVG